MDICVDVPRLTAIGVKLLSQINDTRAPEGEDDKPTPQISNADLLLDFAQKYVFGGQKEDV